ncbi:hypothetical protein BTUL_0226g00200 [Botrytis tulipae]|uniref:Uncharacterized protein n=1 Tax=Botrytis tulipae TaxID=87230 RepID=A0A4Z1EA13_9HELO|nr:hypothetical protein BTUL_0226g00200 [Botrytis tulipae]
MLVGDPNGYASASTNELGMNFHDPEVLPPVSCGWRNNIDIVDGHVLGSSLAVNKIVYHESRKDYLSLAKIEGVA